MNNYSTEQLQKIVESQPDATDYDFESELYWKFPPNAMLQKSSFDCSWRQVFGDLNKDFKPVPKLTKLSDIRAELLARPQKDINVTLPAESADMKGVDGSEKREFKVGDLVVLVNLCAAPSMFEVIGVLSDGVNVVEIFSLDTSSTFCKFSQIRHAKSYEKSAGQRIELAKKATHDQEAAGHRIDEPTQMMTRESLLPPLRNKPVTFLNDEQIDELTKRMNFSSAGYVQLKPEQKILPAIITAQLDPAKCHKVDPTLYDAPADSPRDDLDAMSESHRSPSCKCHEFPFDAELEVPVVASQHPHYFKDVSGLTHIDVYQVLRLYEVTDPCLQHIVKKALCAGKRGSKDFVKDVQEIADTANRLVEIEGGRANESAH